MCIFEQTLLKLFRISARWYTPLFRVYVFLEAVSATKREDECSVTGGLTLLPLMKQLPPSRPPRAES